LKNTEIRTRSRTRTISAILFILPIIGLFAIDLLDIFGPGDVQSAVSSLPPHPMFHVLTAIVGFSLATSLLGISVAFGPYQRGERWAWWSLLLGDLAITLANLVGTLTIYAHTIYNGLIVELLAPLTLLALAVLLSWREFNSSKRAMT
jgi:lysylphosphatidylglycerol synthetase-like protein (DUF2156 family)